VDEKFVESFIQHLFFDDCILQMNHHLLPLDFLLLTRTIHSVSESCQDYLMFLLDRVKENISELKRLNKSRLPIVRKITTKLQSWSKFFESWFPNRMKHISEYYGDPFENFIIEQWEKGYNPLAFFHVTLKRIGNTLFTPEAVSEGITGAEFILKMKRGGLTKEWVFLHSLGEHKDKNEWDDNEWINNADFLNLHHVIQGKIGERDLMEELEDIFGLFLQKNDAICAFFYLPPESSLPITSIDGGGDPVRLQVVNGLMYSMGERICVETKLKEMEHIILIGTKGCIITFYFGGEIVLRIETCRKIFSDPGFRKNISRI